MVNKINLFIIIPVILLAGYLFYFDTNKISYNVSEIKDSNYTLIDLKINEKYLNYFSSGNDFLVSEAGDVNSNRAFFVSDTLDRAQLAKILYKNGYNIGDNINIKMLINDKVYGLEDVIINNYGESYYFSFSDSFDVKSLINLVSFSPSTINNSTFQSEYYTNKDIRFKLNLNLDLKLDDKVGIIIFPK